ncbi:MAG: hypothetical protein ACPGVB_12635 [Chitinophagales bacterium]
MKKGQIPLFFEADQHLNAAGRMLYTDSIQRDKIDLLPNDVYEHVSYCAECSAEILMLVELMEDESIDSNEVHPFFDNPNSDYFLSDDWADIDALLEQIKAEAVTIPLYEKRIEEQLTAQYRSSTSSAIQVISPQNEYLYQGEVTFTFAEKTSSDIILIIRNHHGQVHKAKIPANTLYQIVEFQPSNNFPSGVYYWQMMDKNRNRVVGKFYVYQSN